MIGFTKQVEAGKEYTLPAIADAVKELVLYKNKKYGSSFEQKEGIFFQNREDEKEFASVLIRLDDKIARIKNRKELRVNDIADLNGYTLLLLTLMAKTQDVYAELQKQMD